MCVRGASVLQAVLVQGESEVQQQHRGMELGEEAARCKVGDKVQVAWMHL